MRMGYRRDPRPGEEPVFSPPVPAWGGLTTTRRLGCSSLVGGDFPRVRPPGGSSKKSITGPCPSTTVVTGAGLMRRPGGVWTPLLGSRLPVPVVRGVSVGGPRWPSATAAPPALDGGGAATGWTTPTGG